MISGEKDYSRLNVSQLDGRTSIEKEVLLVAEEPLEIRINSAPYAVTMRTPGNDLELAAGFCLTEGIVDSFAEIDSIGFCPDEEKNAVNVMTGPAAAERVTAEAHAARSRVAKTGCGICGVQTIDDLFSHLERLADGFTVTAECIVGLQYAMSENQGLSRLTRGAHAAALSDREGRLHAVREDVGRHNALDKAIGYALMNGIDLPSSMVLLSSRISFEMVQKAIRACIPVVVALSAATTLAVDLALRFNCTLAGLLRDRSMVVYTGIERIVRK